MYDQGCYDLAAAFLEDVELEDNQVEPKTKALAQAIQTAIEDWLEGEGL